MERSFAPHADVRIVIAEVYKLESGLAAMGLAAPALTEAREMLAALSRKVDHLQKSAGKADE